MVSTAAVNVHDAAELAQAIKENASTIEVVGTITGSPMITLSPGMTLRGGTLEFGAKGVRLTSDNTLEDVTILTAPQEAAILNDTSVSSLGTLILRNVTTRGQILLLAEDRVRSGHVQAERVHIVAADVRGRSRRPHGFGVDALQGGFTLWNRQADPSVVLSAELLDISAGSKEEPIRGSGVFVGGHVDWDGKSDGGTVQVTELRTGEIHADGGIPEATPDLISGGVFIISGAIVQSVISNGPVTTYGQNDMVLDNWGDVKSWTAKCAVTSHGPSGIGFVNFGDIDTLAIEAPIVTTGKGARGFNLYDGSLNTACFDRIETSGDGSIGIQISKPLGTLSVRGDVTTSGGEGLSLVKGVQMPLQAIGLSVKSGGTVDSIDIGGKLATSGDNVTTLEVEGKVKQLIVAGGIEATGKGSNGAIITGDGVNLTGVSVRARHGKAIKNQ